MSAVQRHRRPGILDSIPLNRHTVIEASAGTGKTYTIEHLVIELLLRTDATIDQILVVTFTEKATGELRSRVRGKIEALVRDQGDAAPDEPAWEIGEEERQRLVSALSSFDSAPISTIHAFCQRVLTENAFDGSRLFEQSQVDGDEAFSAAFRESLRLDLATDPENAQWLAAWLEDSGIAALETLLRDCHRARGNIRPTFEDSALSAVRELGLGAFDDVALAAELKTTKMHASTARSVVGEARELVEALRESKAGAASTLLRALSGWKAKRSEGTDSFVLERLSNLAVEGPQIRLLRSLIDVARSAAIPFEAASAQKFLPLVLARLEARKRELGLFDFDDMLELVRQGLSNQQLVTALRERYRFALIDEFQDTDAVQWEIFRKVFFESDANRLYIIGDPKQAIYRFRGADIHTYFKAKAEIVTAGGAKVALAQNYRSTPLVIEAYNRILDQSAPQPFFQRPGTYDEPVGCGDPSLNAVDAHGRTLAPVQLVHLTASGALRVDDAREGFARYVAKEAARLLDGGLFLKRGEKREPLRARDIFVLTRTGGEGLQVGRALRAAGIPHAFYKQDGLFQTDEARDVCDLLSAVVDPSDPSHRMRAWLTPFFGLGVEEAGRARDVSAPHPLLDRLSEWHQLATARDFARLFTSIQEEGGLVRRLLFLDSSERSLTNYQHLFELLLEQAASAPLSAEELVVWLRGRISSVENDGQDSNVQRLETERDAVQIMTMHKSKGLEAAVVFVSGGLKASHLDRVHILPDGEGGRVVHVGKLYDPELKATARREDEEENERLLYVTLTRAKARLYLPYFGNVSSEDAGRLGLSDPTPLAITGAYACVQRRLESLLAGGPCESVDGVPLFEREVVVCDAAREDAVDAEDVDGRGFWSPPSALLDTAEATEDLESLRRRHAGFLVTSYSRMAKSQRGIAPRGEVERAEEIEDAEESAPTQTMSDGLPGGREMGNFLHDLLELAPVESFESAQCAESWREQASIKALLHDTARRHGIAEKHLAKAAEIVHASLTGPVALGSDGVLQGIRTASVLLRETEFLYPIPEKHHPQLSDVIRDEGFSIERGFVKGFVDVIFTHNGRAYFGDWKSDRLENWNSDTLSERVQSHYALQARLYSLALVKMLGIHDEASYELKFGGLLYFFIRAMQPASSHGDGGAASEGRRGIYLERPSFKRILEWENELRNRSYWGGSV